jgi:SAM-dependent methyltransferase
LFLKRKLKDGIRAFGSLPLVSPMISRGSVRSVLSRLPGSHALYGSGWNLSHPFDRAHGIDASGLVTSEELRADGDHPALAHVTIYGGSQPSAVRAALASLPELETSSFVDLGCGKGRPLIVASEFPFRDIIGVELSENLARQARVNASKIAARYPERTPIRVETGDATAYPLPSGNVVLFMYHAFGPELVRRVVASVEAALRAEPERSIYVVLYNPVNGACFDESPLLSRRLARMFPYSAEERGYGPDAADAIIIWQGGRALHGPRDAHADARIVITLPNMRAEVEAVPS